MPDTKHIHTNYDFDDVATVTGLKEPVEDTDAVRLQDTESFGIVVSTDSDPGRTIFVGSIEPVDGGYTPEAGDIWIHPTGI